MTPRNRSPRTHRTDLSNADWTMTNRQLADQYQVSICTVRAYRKQHGTQPYSRYGPSYITDAELLERADWTKNNPQIAASLGVNRDRVRRLRSQHGKPPSPGQRASARYKWTGSLNQLGGLLRDAGKPGVIDSRLGQMTPAERSKIATMANALHSAMIGLTQSSVPKVLPGGGSAPRTGVSTFLPGGRRLPLQPGCKSPERLD